MKNQQPLSGKLIVLAGILSAALLLVACDQSKPSVQSVSASTGARGAANAATTQQIFIQFEGPWAFVPDPKDPNNVIAIAPKAKGHNDLYVKASNDRTLASGIYDLSLPAQAVTTPTVDPVIVQAQIGQANVQHALDSKSARYAIRLRKPEAYLAAGRAESRIGSTYPPPAATQGDHATAVSLRYSVSSTTGLTLGGTPDTGTFNPLLLQVDTPIVRFVIEPAQMDDPLDHCETHSRESFRDLVKLLGVALYMDFPNYTADCQKNDAQRASSEAPRSVLDRLAVALTTNLLDQNTRTASLTGGGSVPALLKFAGINNGRPLMAVVYLFSHGSADCKSAVVIFHF